MTDMIEKMTEEIAKELDKQEMLLADPITLRRLMAKRCAKAALSALDPTSKDYPDECWDRMVAAGTAVTDRCVAPEGGVVPIGLIFHAMIQSAKGEAES